MSDRNHWTTADIPQLSGKLFVVTGANSGLGLDSVKALTAHGAKVVMACRTESKARAAIDEVRADTPDADVEFIALDLASLESIALFSGEMHERFQTIDCLINNAGVMAIPKRSTADGFEMQLGTNHFGHFALTGCLLDMLVDAGSARVVSVSSMAHKQGKMRFDDLNWTTGYNRWVAYAQSKLANLLFAFELQRRLEAAGLDVISVAAHPGYSATNLQFAGAEMDGSGLKKKLWGAVNAVAAQSSEMGALPQLYAAVSDDVQGGDYIGPGGMMETRGYPKKVGATKRARDLADAKRLWEVSEQLTGVRFEALATSAAS